MSAVKISIVVPVYNSEDCVLELTKAVALAFISFDSYELILVNDKSIDKSWERIIEACGANKNIIGISLRKNSGQDAALMAGLRASKGEYVVIMDDDLQHSPSDIFKLYEKCREGYDVCFGLFAPNKQKGWKGMGSWLNGKLAEKLLDKPKEIYLSPFKIITREVVNEITNSPAPYPYVDATILTITSNLTQTVVSHHERFKGKSSYSFIRSLWVFINHATNYSVYPLRLLTITGFISSIFSFILGAFYLFQHIYDNHKVEGWITIVILLIFFGGLILMSIGLIGEYIGRIFMAVNKKPQYIIEKVINS